MYFIFYHFIRHLDAPLYFFISLFEDRKFDFFFKLCDQYSLLMQVAGSAGHLINFLLVSSDSPVSLSFILVFHFFFFHIVRLHVLSSLYFSWPGWTAYALYWHLSLYFSFCIFYSLYDFFPLIMKQVGMN